MNRLVIPVVVGAAGVIGAAVYLTRSAPETELEERWGFVNQYCVDCHNGAEFAGEFSFEGMNASQAHAEADLFERAIRKLRVGQMPPADAAQPDPEARYGFISAVENTLDEAAEEGLAFAGTKSVHRLNRAEYANTIRDLLGIEVDVSALLPSDGAAYGFDNIASALTTSPLLLERYLTAALRVSALAVGDETAAPTEITYTVAADLTQDQHIDGLPLGTRGGIVVRHNFPADAQYILAGRLFKAVLEGYKGVEGHDTPHEFLILVDGVEVHSAMVGGPEDHAVNVENVAEGWAIIDPRMTSAPVPITAGPHDLAFTWSARPAMDQSVWQPALAASIDTHNVSGFPRLGTVSVEGPYDVTGVSETPSRERLMVCRPESAAEEAGCAEEIVATLARRAYRRAIDAQDLEEPLVFYNEARASGGTFDNGIQAAVARVLVSPAFLFRSEADPADLAGGSSHPISDIELASRLSFFLWSSIPDDELLDIAIDGRLSEPDVLEAQVRRMVADDRSAAFVENFIGQWLQLRNLEQSVRPDPQVFPDFDDNLRQAFRQETEMLFASTLRENRSVLDLMRADYTYVNERLARHYGIPGVYGTRFRRVEVTDPNRQGLLGHGSILSLTSASTRTSPIIRGTFVVSNFMNSPPPEPPPAVPALEESAPTGRPSTIREQLELHRENPECNACHRNLDPLGFALENFDATGGWRDVNRDGLPIDAAGVLADGTAVSGPAELREAILADPEVFAGTVTEKLLIYALGRGLEPADMPQVRDILRTAAADDYRLMSIILGIVDSLPFQMRTKLSSPNAMETIAQNRE